MVTKRNAVAGVLLILSHVAAECPNACSGHGTCASHDMCICERNWQGGDCSQRTCPFGISHVDTPKGDLDATNSISDASTDVIIGSTVYPYGTTEGYPKMVDTGNQVLSNTAHAYMECSNKGQCNRETGMCECLKGYDGVACQRASCPGTQPPFTRTYGGAEKRPQESTVGVCSGHGTCESIAELAALDNNNVYKLWDKDISMGCKCDAGYSGLDCFDRMCKYGIDPLYVDDVTTRVTETVVRIESTVGDTLSGKYSIRFFDVFGEDYLTKPIDISGDGVINTVTHCTSVTAALKELPDKVVKDVECTQTVLAANTGVEYVLKFVTNPGKLKQLEIHQHLDGSLPTIIVSSGSYTSVVYNKVTGEFEDYFPTKCEGITVKVLADSAGDDSWETDARPGSIGYLSGKTTYLTDTEKNVLKKCLSDSDTNPDNNIDVQNWDPGFVIEASGVTPDTHKMIGAFPHAIKVVPVPSTMGYDQFTSGDYHLVWYDSTATAGKEFRVANLNTEANLETEATEMHVFTTAGIVQQLGYGDESTQQLASYDSVAADYKPIGSGPSSRIVGYFNAYSNRVYTNYDTSCDNQPTVGAKNHKCINKGDRLFIVDGCWGKGMPLGTTDPFFGGIDPADSCADSLETSVNHETGNLYTVTKLYNTPMHANSTLLPTDQHDYLTAVNNARYVNTFVIEVDAHLGWDGTALGDPENGNTGSDDTTWSENTGKVVLFHFTPPTAVSSSYEYVSQCSNRGNCDSASGLCKCYRGYTGEDCSIQSILALGFS